LKWQLVDAETLETVSTEELENVAGLLIRRIGGAGGVEGKN